jgi:hypothetical protein
LNNVETIDDSAFIGSRLETIDLSHVTSIGTRTFYANSKTPHLQSVTFGNKITTIPLDCFSGQTLLTNIDCKNVSNIGYGAFSGCSGLTTLTCSNVSSIEDSAFVGCTGL